MKENNLDYLLSNENKEFLKEKLRENKSFLVVGTDNKTNVKMINSLLNLLEKETPVTISQNKGMESIISKSENEIKLFTPDILVLEMRRYGAIVFDKVEDEELLKNCFKAITSAHQLILGVNNVSFDDFLKKYENIRPYYETIEKSSDLVVITIVKKSEDNIEFLIK
jgi:hypothetical protein